MRVYVYFQPPFHAVFSNHEVVVFQPRTGTAIDLVSIANCTFILAIPPHLSQQFSGSFIYPYVLVPPPISSRLSPYHLYIATATHFLSWNKNMSTWMFPTPSTHQPPPLDSAPPDACLRLPPFTVSICSPFSTLGLRLGTCQPLKVRPLRVLMSPLCLRLSSLCYTLTPEIFSFLVYCFDWKSVLRLQEASSPPLPGDLLPQSLPLLPPLLGHASVVKAIRTPPPI